MKYRKKPVVIDAVEYNGSTESICSISDFVGEKLTIKTDDSMIIHTLNGLMQAAIGDFITKDSCDNFYVCSKELFEMTYEKA